METKLRLSTLGMVAFNLNTAIEAGHIDDFGFAEVYEAIGKGTIVGFLDDKLGHDVNLSLLRHPPGRAQHEAFVEVMKYTAPSFEGSERQLGVQRSGMCLMMALVLVAMQEGYWSGGTAAGAGSPL